ncbi:DUF4154 domain-containing protein [Pseudodesulfovibrio sp. F-1]|uniref:DUF4154 domain-containing protein n=1 Tax=Pseudodesulfovibrio alkaliphilus TaxID=2661613 RepID=A0A7K1KL55_9BACT|nr:YfiR family protein [Pseudodesulfovibrio alkaliphilus]MUM76770.1 DUF4154 domain-containing protein [Pseudodesulfovibrio alkaliphilus]
MGFLNLVRPIQLAAALALIVFLVTVPASVVDARDQRLTATIDQLQALFVQRMVRYVVWPDTETLPPGSPIIVAAIDAESLRPHFTDGLAHGRFQLVQWPVDMCHVLILVGTPDRTAAAILQTVTDRPVLTVTQSPSGMRMGAVVNFILKNGRLRFEINPAAAERTGLSISSRLLGLARIYLEADDAR